MKGDAHFPSASNSKLFTSVAIYQLYEQGKLDVDANIATMLDKEDFKNFGLHSWVGRRFCPRVKHSWTPWKCETITLRHLLSMSSGIYPSLNCDFPGSQGRCNPDPYFVNRGSIGKTVGTFILEPLIFAPGTEYHYSNPNFILAAYFVEKYSGMTFREYLRQHIFQPIGLKDTYYDFYNRALGLDPQRVGQYVRYHDVNSFELMSVGADVLQLDLGVASGTGGIVSTVADYATFWYALFNKTTQGAPLVSKESQQAILTPWNLMETTQWQWPNGTAFQVWMYYTQGTVIACDAKECGPDHIRWIMYTGGTITVHTANLLDYQSMKMVQVWTSTLVSVVDPDTLQTIFDQQTGAPTTIVSKLLAEDLNNPMGLAFAKMNENYLRYNEPKEAEQDDMQELAES